MKNFLFKKVELWVVGVLLLIFFVSIIFIAGVLRDAYLSKNKSPELLRNFFVGVSEIPKNVYRVSRHFIKDTNKPPILKRHKKKEKLKNFLNFKRNALLVLPRYDHHLNRSIVEIIDLYDFKVLHTYKHDIDEMNKQVQNIKEFPRINIDNAPIRFRYMHPVILNDGSLISDSSGPLFKIDLCSNLLWINDEEVFHHSKELNHENDIWSVGYLNPTSRLMKKIIFKDVNDDAIIKINTNGKIIYKKSVNEILIENKKGDMVNRLGLNNDPIHINDIEPALFNSKYWNKGDVFISSRYLSAIIHFRPSTNEVINFLTGPFSQQHDVDIISDKEISIFNNNNFISHEEYSEIIIYNFEKKEYRKMFNDQLIKENFKTYSEGLSHIFEDGSLIVEEQNHGRLILFNKEGYKEWEFVNKDINGDIGITHWIRVIEDELFIEKFKTLVENKKCKN
ncbi:arylsulfotransferase family protein [Candidatus Pelagibacter sp.]|nr:arylsulfotransferase family protein [Candidatus Pelagibacter sp.]